MNNQSKAYLVGGGIGSMAAAAFLVRDGKLPGENISILEALPVMGGSLDAAGDPVNGYSLRGGRMLTTDNYECTWDLFKTIPSLTDPAKSVFEETVAFNERHKAHSMARLVDRRRAKVPVTSMGFSMRDRMELLKLSRADEEEMGASRITDWLSPGILRDRILVHVGDDLRLPALAQRGRVQALSASLHAGVHAHRDPRGRQANDLQPV